MRAFCMLAVLSIASCSTESPDPVSAAGPAPIMNAKLTQAVVDFVDSGDEGELEVLVVLRTPQPDLSVFTQPEVDWESAVAKKPDPKEAQRIAKAIEPRLRALSSTEPVWLGNVDAFLVRLDADAIQEVGAMDDVLEIAPNAKLRSSFPD